MIDDLLKDIDKKLNTLKALRLSTDDEVGDLLEKIDENIKQEKEDD